MRRDDVVDGRTRSVYVSSHFRDKRVRSQTTVQRFGVRRVSTYSRVW